MKARRQSAMAVASRGGRTDFVLDAQWLEKLPKELQDAHRDFIALRDKHVGHSVNDWELNIPIAYLRIDETTGHREVSSVSVQSRRIVGLTLDSIRSIS